MNPAYVTSTAPGTIPAPAPVQIAIALRFLEHQRQIEAPTVAATPAGTLELEPGRKLDINELRTRDAALELLRAYFANHTQPDEANDAKPRTD